MPASSPNQNKYSMWHFVGLALALAIIFLIAAVLSENYHLTHEILRDVGIAFLVAVIVTIIYELHTRTLYDLHTITGVFQAITGDMVHPDIWKEVKGVVIERDMIRHDVQIKMKVIPIAEDKMGGTRLWMEFSYKLNGLRSKNLSNVTVMHYLDFHLKDEKAELPRFEYIEIDGKVFDAPPGLSDNENVKKGRFTTSVNLEPRGKKPIQIVTRRSEKTYLPGTYNLIMGEMTKGITLHLLEIPDNVEASVNLRPHTEYGRPLEVGKPLTEDFKDTILLPGQGIEFRFINKENVPQPNTSASSPTVSSK